MEHSARRSPAHGLPSPLAALLSATNRLQNVLTSTLASNWGPIGWTIQQVQRHPSQVSLLWWMGHEIFQRCDSDLDWTACGFCLETGSARLMDELQGKQSMSWMQCLLQGFSESRSRGHSAGEVCWWPHLLTFWGFTKLLFLQLFSLSSRVCISVVHPPYHRAGDHTALLESDSFPTLFLSNDLSHFSLFWKLCFLQSQHPKVQLSMFSAYFKCYFPLTGQTTCWHGALQKFPSARWAGENR